MRRPPLPVLLSLALLLLLTDSASGALFTRGPSLWRVTTNSILIAWQTDTPSSGKVLYSTHPGAWTAAADTATGTEHSVTLHGLQPATQYYYRVVIDDVLLTTHLRFRTAPSGVAPFRFVAFGDCGVADANQYAVAARVDSLNPDLGLILGDVIYEAGEAANFTPRYFTPYASIINHAVFYPVVGNHDIITGGGQPFLDAFYLPTNSKDGSEKYYSFDYANVHFVALDGNDYFNADMYDWVEADLAATTKRWNIVYFHQPMYTEPSTHTSDLNLRLYLEPIFVYHHVDLVLQGHNHNYCRSYPIRNGTAVDTAQGSSYHNPGGVIYLVAGGGGRVLYPFTGHDPLIRSAFSVFHTVAVDVAGDSMYVQAVLPNGTVFDCFSIVKRASTAVEASGHETFVGSVQATAGGPVLLSVRKPKPHPFERSAELSFTLPRASQVHLTIRDVHGRMLRELVSAELQAGEHSARWDGKDDRGRNAATGVYFATLDVGGTVVKTRLALLR